MSESADIYQVYAYTPHTPKFVYFLVHARCQIHLGTLYARLESVGDIPREAADVRGLGCVGGWGLVVAVAAKL